MVRRRMYLVLIILLSLFLDFYGIGWGLPSRWNVDQAVTPALNMLREGSFFPSTYFQPSLYYYLLLIFITPFLVFQKLFNPVFPAFLRDAGISWNFMAIRHPDIASGIILTARLSSVIFSVLTLVFVYKTAKKIYSKKAGLFAALILCLSMDFVNWAHMEKSIALTNLLTVSSIYYLVSVYKGDRSRKDYILSCLFAGLASSVKFNGLILLLAVPIGAWGVLKDEKHKYPLAYLKQNLIGLFTFVGSLLLTSPALVFRFKQYYHYSVQMRTKTFLIKDASDVLNIALGNINGILHTFVDMFGLLLALLICLGLIYSFRKGLFKNAPVKIVLFFAFIIPASFIFNQRVYMSCDSKFLAQGLPLLAILAGIFCADFLTGSICAWLKRRLRIILLFVIFAGSLFYCLDLDSLFLKKDLRYKSTQWISNNLKSGSNIIVYTQLEYSLGVDVLKRFNVYVLGGEAGTPLAYSFKGAEYSVLDNLTYNKVINGMIKQPVYLVLPCWSLRWGRHYECDMPATLRTKARILMKFERQNPWFWNPGLGGYEPSGIRIYQINGSNTK